jgi:rod shape determining protein RodA
MTVAPTSVRLRWQQADPLLLLAAIGLTGLGVVLVMSATWKYPDQPSFMGNPWIVKQSAFAIVGVAAMVACAAVPPALLRALAYPVYGASLVALGVVLVLGHGKEAYGAQRWIEVAGVALQPSEPAKVALAIALAQLMASRAPGLRSILISGALTAPALLLVYLEPDLGTALSLGVIWFGTIVLSGVPARFVVAMITVAAGASPLIWLGLEEYMRARVLTFLNPQADALGQGYNILQAQISIGSGGMWGKGLFEGTQTQLRYLRVSHSDFIFSVLGEELGFVGAMILFALFIVLLFRILRAYDAVDDRFAALICAGVAWMVAFPALANVGANVGLTPVVGIPLPFVSYGGSALVSHLAALGFVQGALMRRRFYRFEA